MWGLSYAANVALRTASRRPPALGAIIAVAHGLDPARDSVHPDGARGDLHALANRGSSLLLQQLLPPLTDSSPAGLRRWRQRMLEAEPAFLDYARHGPGDPVWRERAIDGAAIQTPVLCVGGWRDAFPDGLIDAYEQVAGPKKLLMGPWGHLLPHRSAYRPVDFLAIALRWWDHWLRGVPTGVMEEPAVTLFRPGPAPRWLGYEAWPPPAINLRLATACRHHARARHAGAQQSGDRPAPAGRHRRSAARAAGAGDGRGLPGPGPAGRRPAVGDRDQRAAARPGSSSAAGRKCQSGSAAASAGWLPGSPTSTRTAGRCWSPPACCVRSSAATGSRCGCARSSPRSRPGTGCGSRSSDADFPRLMPLVSPVPFEVRSVEVSVPVLRDGAPVDLPAVPAVPQQPGNDLRVSRDPTSGEVEVVVTGRVPEQVSPGGHRYRLTSELHARVGPAAPEAAEAGGTQVSEVRLTSGEVVRAAATVRCTQTAVWARAEVCTNGSVVFSRTWETVLVPECPVIGGR